MKKIYAIGLMVTASLLAGSFIFADEGETEEPSNVAPAVIQAPSAQPAPQPAAEPTPTAEPAPAPKPACKRIISETTLQTADLEYISGSVARIVPSSLRQPRSKIVITDQGGSEIEFTVKALAVIYDPNGCIMSLDKLQQGTRVEVHYRTSCEGVRIATSIKVLK